MGMAWAEFVTILVTVSKGKFGIEGIGAAMLKGPGENTAISTQSVIIIVQSIHGHTLPSARNLALAKLFKSRYH